MHWFGWNERRRRKKSIVAAVCFPLPSSAHTCIHFVWPINRSCSSRYQIHPNSIHSFQFFFLNATKHQINGTKHIIFGGIEGEKMAKVPQCETQHANACKHTRSSSLAHSGRCAVREREKKRAENANGKICECIVAVGGSVSVCWYGRCTFYFSFVRWICVFFLSSLSPHPSAAHR